MYEWTNSRGPGWPVHYEGDVNAPSADMFSYTYASPERLERLATTEGDNFAKPVVLCEYAHVMGNGPGILEDHQQLFRKYRRLQGGWIWEWANHGLVHRKEGKEFFAYGGDIDDFPNDGTSVMDCLCYSDHTPTPGLLEAKKVFSPVRAHYDTSRRKLVVINEQDFQALDGFDLFYKVESITEQTIILISETLCSPNVDPHEQGEIELPLSGVHMPDFGEVWLTCTSRLRNSTDWAEASHLINVCHIRLDRNDTQRRRDVNSGTFKVSDNRRSIKITREEFSLIFDKARGSIFQWTHEGVVSFSAQQSGQDVLAIDVWRAPPDNDAAWQSAECKNYGLNDMKLSILSCEITARASTSISIKCHQNIMAPILAWGFEVLHIHSITANGVISIKSTIKPFGSAPKNVPRVVLNLQLSSSFDRVSWFGLGPGESYSDKKLAQLAGIHSSSLDALQTRYDVPREMGNHMETRWLKVTDATDTGFRVQYNGAPNEKEHFQWALLRYDAEMLEKARHPCDLVARNGPLLRLDCDVAGLGTAACGPGTKVEDQVECREREFEFILSPM